MAQLPREFRKSPEGFISFAYSDFIRQTGVIVMYGAKTHSGYVLTPTVVYSDTAGFSTTNQSPGTVFNENFDITFAKAADLEGVLLANIPHYVADNNTATVSVVVTVSKVSSSTTQLDQETSTNHVTAAGGFTTVVDQIFCVELDIPFTHFAKDDILRINVTVTLSVSGTANEFIIGHDPANRSLNGNMTSSQMAFHVPFRINL